MSAQLDRDEVKLALNAGQVLDHYQWIVKGPGAEVQSAQCPRRSDHSRERALVMNVKTGRWQCFPCGYGGDLFDFIAEVERLDVSADFSKVIELAAQIAGVAGSTRDDAERAQRRAEWAKRRQVADARERADKTEREQAAIPRATGYWDDLETQNERGEQYLAERGVSDAIRFRCVRFDQRHAGSPSLALHTRDGRIRNVVRRRLPELGDPKATGLPECPTAGTLINSISELLPKHDVVITEGVFDSITAAVAFRRAFVLGAHGANNLPKIAKLAAPRVAELRGRLLIIPHEDTNGAGYRAARSACQFALDAGLRTRDGTLVIVKTGAKDLSEAWQHGWRPAA